LPGSSVGLDGGGEVEQEAAVKKDEAKVAIVSFIDRWHEAECPEIPRGELRFSPFYSWLQRNSPGHLRFKSSTRVKDDVERWFDTETKQNWRN
jgi:hypothetical protein